MASATRSTSSSFGPKPVFFSEMAAHKGKMIGMFRMPAQKIAAGFVNAFESCPTMQHEHGPSCNPAPRELRHRLVPRGDEPDAADGGEVLQLRQGVPGEHAERQVLRRCESEVRRGGAGEHGRPRRRVREPARFFRGLRFKRHLQNRRRPLRRRRPRGEVRGFGSQTSQVSHGRGRDRGRGCPQEGPTGRRLTREGAMRRLPRLAR